MTFRIATLALLAAAAVAPAAVAQRTDAAFAATTLQISAHGEVKLPPDQAMITLGVETTASTAAQAMGANAEKMNRVVAALKAAGVADRDIQTDQLSLSPQYAYAEGQSPRLTDYQASNQVTVTVNDLTRLGRLTDAVVGAGATNVSGISFGLANPVAAENTARVAAVKSLEDKARLYADAAGYRIGRLVNLSEGGGTEVQVARPMAMMAARNVAATPVAAGEVDVRVDVQGIFELAK
jgi:hypothetical protein